MTGTENARKTLGEILHLYRAGEHVVRRTLLDRSTPTVGTLEFEPS